MLSLNIRDISIAIGAPGRHWLLNPAAGSEIRPHGQTFRNGTWFVKVLFVIPLRFTAENGNIRPQ